jgi:hypothetical protein
MKSKLYKRKKEKETKKKELRICSCNNCVREPVVKREKKHTCAHIYQRANKTREEEEEEATTKLTMTTDSIDNCARQIEKMNFYKISLKQKGKKTDNIALLL